jgi:hypothetical protein
LREQEQQRENDEAFLPQRLATTSSHNYQAIPFLNNFLNNLFLIRSKTQKPEVILKTSCKHISIEKYHNTQLKYSKLIKSHYQWAKTTTFPLHNKKENP